MKSRGFIAFLLLLLPSCEGINRNTQLNVGFSETSNEKISPWLKTAVRGNFVQESEITLIVYVGYFSHFYDCFVDGIYKDYSFVLQREIWSEDWKESYKTILEADLSDFSDESKYAISFDKQAGEKSNLMFGYSFEDKFDCDSVPLNKGMIAYTFCLLDFEKNIDEKILLEFGMSVNYINFVKESQLITFSD